MKRSQPYTAPLADPLKRHIIPLYEPPMQTSAEISIENPTADGCRFIVRIKHQDRPGFQRIAQDITADMLSSIVLFTQALSITTPGSYAARQSIEIGSLSLSYDGARNVITLSRALGNVTQEAHILPEDLIEGLKPALSAALKQAQDCPGGSFIANHMAALKCPVSIAGSDLDRCLRAITVILLATETRRKGSLLLRHILSKTKQDAARRDIAEVYNAILSEIMPAGEEIRLAG